MYTFPYSLAQKAFLPHASVYFFLLDRLSDKRHVPKPTFIFRTTPRFPNALQEKVRHAPFSISPIPGYQLRPYTNQMPPRLRSNIADIETTPSANAVIPSEGMDPPIPCTRLC